MHINRYRVLSFLSVLLFCCSFQASALSVANISDPGVIISSSSLGFEDLTGEISAIDILPLLNTSGSVNVSMPASVAVITVAAGQTFSPNAIRPGAEVVYILGGSADISADDAVVNASVGDAILVPAGSVMMVKNTGAETLTLFSILSADGVERIADQKLIKRSQDSKPLVMFGNATDSDFFTVNRMYSTFEESLPITFDLAIVTLSAGNSVQDHYLENGQLGYVLSGTGNITIGCKTHLISEGDITYVPPYAVQRFDSDDDLRILLLTEPFYRPEMDHSSTGLC